tara:strand:- start:199 stop:909 length:711 start_codon:yes stop_codon:yes gene_type:complete
VPALETILSQIRGSLQNQTYESLGLRLVKIMSATQEPRNYITFSGISEHIDVIPGDTHILKDTILIKNFLIAQGLAYTPIQVWEWLVHTEGFDITALFHGDTVLGATVGFYAPEIRTYLTHLTAVKRDMQGGQGRPSFRIGQFLREKQIEWLYQRLERVPMQMPPLHAVSLSANPDARNNPRGAVEFQIHTFTQVLEWTIAGKAPERINTLNSLYPFLHLEVVMRQNVTPLHFVDD